MIHAFDSRTQMVVSGCIAEEENAMQMPAGTKWTGTTEAAWWFGAESAAGRRHASWL